MSTPLEEYLAAKQSDVSASASSSTSNLVNARSPTKPIVRRGTISRQSPTKSLHPGTTVSPTKSTMTYHSSESTPSLLMGNSSRVRGSPTRTKMPVVEDPFDHAHNRISEVDDDSASLKSFNMGPNISTVSLNNGAMEVARTGWLWRRGTYMNWKRCYAVANTRDLKAGILCFYKTDTELYPYRTIDLTECVDIVPRDITKSNGTRYEFKLAMRKSDVWLAADTIPDMQQWVETLNCLIPKIVEPGLERIEQELYSVHYRNSSLQTMKTELEMENSRLQNILSETNDQALEKEAHMRGLLIRAQQNEEMLRDKVESYESEIQRLLAQNEELSEKLKVQSAQLLLSESKEIEAQQYSLHGAIERIQSTIDEHVQSLDKSVDVSNETLGSLRSLETIVSDLVVSFHSKNSEGESKTSELLSDMKQTLASTLGSFTELQTTISDSLRSMQTASDETSASLSKIQSTLTSTISSKLNNIGDHLDTLTTSHSQLLTFLSELQETTLSSSPRGRTGINIDDNRMSAVQEFMETIDSKLSSTSTTTRECLNEFNERLERGHLNLTSMLACIKDDTSVLPCKVVEKLNQLEKFVEESKMLDALENLRSGIEELKVDKESAKNFEKEFQSSQKTLDNLVNSISEYGTGKLEERVNEVQSDIRSVKEQILPAIHRDVLTKMDALISQVDKKMKLTESNGDAIKDMSKSITKAAQIHHVEACKRDIESTVDKKVSAVLEKVDSLFDVSNASHDTSISLKNSLSTLIETILPSLQSELKSTFAAAINSLSESIISSNKEATNQLSALSSSLIQPQSNQLTDLNSNLSTLLSSISSLHSSLSSQTPQSKKELDIPEKSSLNLLISIQDRIDNLVSASENVKRTNNLTEMKVTDLFNLFDDVKALIKNVPAIIQERMNKEVETMAQQQNKKMEEILGMVNYLSTVLASSAPPSSNISYTVSTSHNSITSYNYNGIRSLTGPENPIFNEDWKIGRMLVKEEKLELDSQVEGLQNQRESLENEIDELLQFRDLLKEEVANLECTLDEAKTRQVSAPQIDGVKTVGEKDIEKLSMFKKQVQELFKDLSSLEESVIEKMGGAGGEIHDIAKAKLERGTEGLQRDASVVTLVS